MSLSLPLLSRGQDPSHRVTVAATDALQNCANSFARWTYHCGLRPYGHQTLERRKSTSGARTRQQGPPIPDLLQTLIFRIVLNYGVILTDDKDSAQVGEHWQSV